MSDLKDDFYSERDKRLLKDTLDGVNNLLRPIKKELTELKPIKTELKPIKTELKSINEKLDNHITDTTKEITKLATGQVKLEKRMDGLESGQAEIKKLLNK